MGSVFYNENEPYAAAWLRNLSDAGHIAEGVVDDRSIRDIRPADVDGYVQCHWFAGIGIWSYALRLAGWADGFPVWTASCPCQPFSQAGRGDGFEDERHLWPVLFLLIRKHRPRVVFGEQVAGPDGELWFEHVAVQLESIDYAVTAVDIPACSVGAPHTRQRLFWVAHPVGERLEGLRLLRRDDEGGREQAAIPQAARGGEAGGMAQSPRRGPQGRAGCRASGETRVEIPTDPGEALGLGDTHRTGPQGRRRGRSNGSERATGSAGVAFGLGNPDGERAGRDPRAMACR